MSHGLEALRLIGESGSNGTTRRELDLHLGRNFTAISRAHLQALLDLNAVEVRRDDLDARRNRYLPTWHTPELVAAGDALVRWIVEHLPDRQVEIWEPVARRSLLLGLRIWDQGIAAAISDVELSVDQVASRLGDNPSRIRRIVDEAARLGLIEKRQQSDGRNLLSTTRSFSRLVLVAARVAAYRSSALGSDLSCLSDMDLNVALVELVKSVDVTRQMDASIALTVHRRDDIPDHPGVTVVVTYRGGVPVRHDAAGYHTAAIDADLSGWIKFLTLADRSGVTWDGRGSSSVIKAIQDFVKA